MLARETNFSAAEAESDASDRRIPADKTVPALLIIGKPEAILLTLCSGVRAIEEAC